MSKTGGSTNLFPRLLIIKLVAQKETRSGRSERTTIILCSSLHCESHSPGRSWPSGAEETYHFCHSREYCSKEDMIPWKLVNLSNSVILSQAGSGSHDVHGLSICPSLSRTIPPRRKKLYSSIFSLI